MLYNKVYVANNDTRPIGELFFRRGRGVEWQVFRYDDSWLDAGFQIDPELPLIVGEQRAFRAEFGCFSDAAPDSWGRALLRRMYQRTEGRTTLFPSEYLLGVSDEYRIGSFRFYDSDGRIYDSDGRIIPKNSSVLASKDLKELNSLIMQFQKGENISDSDFFDIVHYGSSLGGARPKLSVKAEDGTYWIAKFSSIHDTYDNPAREAISLLLAKKCGLNVPDFHLIPMHHDSSVLLVKRFDREENRRIPYLSAKTILKAEDGTSNDYSYLDLAAAIEAVTSSTTRQDLKELYSRMIFNVVVGNKDDHLRNHGVIHQNGLWQLSPVFDLEISPDKTHHSLALDDTGSLDCPLSTIIEMSEYFQVTQSEARDAVEKIREIAADWKSAAAELSIPKSSVRKMPAHPSVDDL